MRPLSGLDATFVYLESDHSPMHIGGVYLIDAADAPPDFNYESLRSHITSRLQCSRVFRERLVEVPLDLSRPYWINDPEFDLDAHLPGLTLRRPGGKRELMQLAAEIFGHTLDRNRPLWDLCFVDGLDDVPGLAKGSYALITRAHHAAVDGGSGVEMVSALLDVSPQPRVIDAVDDWEPEDLPGTASMVAKTYAGLGRKSVEFGKFVGEVARGTAQMYGIRQIRKLDPPPRLLSAPRTVFNGPVSSSRTFWATDFEFDIVRRIRKAVPDATVNDVLLAICSGGLRRYLRERGVLPQEPLVAMAPVSVRKEDDKGKMGNQVSAMLVNLETDTDDPLQRLLSIRRNTHNSKIHSSALPAEKLTEFIPSETAAAAARLYTRTRLGGRHRPFFNLTITNVPGPPAPLYIAGAPLKQMFGMAPILDGLGLLIVIFSYAGRISISLTSCLGVVPDPERLAGCMDQALAELEGAVGQAQEIPTMAESRQQAPQSEKPVSARETLRQFHEASRSLDDAIESLKRRTKF
jgi:WS/DGAT/MGAT family acyltransferase